MDRVITGALICDPLGEAKPSYQVESSTIYYLDSLTSVKEINCPDPNFEVPMLSYTGEWKMSWLKEPKEIKSALELLFLTAIQDANIKQIEGLDLSKPLTASIYLCSPEYKSSIYNKNVSDYRSFVSVPNMSNDTVVALPEPEWLGVMPVRNQTVEGGEFGGLIALLDKIKIHKV